MQSAIKLTRLALLAALAMPAVAYADSSVRFDGSVVKLGANVRVLGESDRTAPVHFTVALRPREEDALAALLARHERVTPEELKNRFLPTQAERDAVTTWLTSNGLTIEHGLREVLSVHATGSVGDVSRVLGVHFSHITIRISSAAPKPSAATRRPAYAPPIKRLPSPRRVQAPRPPSLSTPCR